MQTKCVGRKRTYWRRVLPAVGVFGQWSVRAPVDTGVRVVMDVLITPIERRGRPGPCRVLPFSLCQKTVGARFCGRARRLREPARKSVGKGKSGLVRVDIVGRRII